MPRASRARERERTRHARIRDVPGTPQRGRASRSRLLRDAVRENADWDRRCAFWTARSRDKIGGAVGDARGRASIALPYLRRSPRFRSFGGRRRSRTGAEGSSPQRTASPPGHPFCFYSRQQRFWSFVEDARRRSRPATRAALPRAQPRDGPGRAWLEPWSGSLRWHSSGALGSRVRSPEARRSLRCLLNARACLFVARGEADQRFSVFRVRLFSRVPNRGPSEKSAFNKDERDSRSRMTLRSEFFSEKGDFAD